jgi:hypothetical protein
MHWVISVTLCIRRAVRQAYLQNGGNDPDILAQLAQMQAEAQAIDDSLKNAQKKQPKGEHWVVNIFCKNVCFRKNGLRVLWVLPEREVMCLM